MQIAPAAAGLTVISLEDIDSGAAAAAETAAETAAAEKAAAEEKKAAEAAAAAEKAAAEEKKAAAEAAAAAEKKRADDAAAEEKKRADMVVLPQCLHNLSHAAQQSAIELRQTHHKPKVFMLPEGFPTRKAAVNAALANRGLHAGTNDANNQWTLLDALTDFSWPQQVQPQQQQAVVPAMCPDKVNRSL